MSTASCPDSQGKQFLRSCICCRRAECRRRLGAVVCTPSTARVGQPQVAERRLATLLALTLSTIFPFGNLERNAPTTWGVDRSTWRFETRKSFKVLSGKAGSCPRIPPCGCGTFRGLILPEPKSLGHSIIPIGNDLCSCGTVAIQGSLPSPPAESDQQRMEMAGMLGNCGCWKRRICGTLVCCPFRQVHSP